MPSKAAAVGIVEYAGNLPVGDKAEMGNEVDRLTAAIEFLAISSILAAVAGGCKESAKFGFRRGRIRRLPPDRLRRRLHGVVAQFGAGIVEHGRQQTLGAVGSAVQRSS